MFVESYDYDDAMKRPAHGKGEQNREAETLLGSIAGLPVTARASFFPVRLAFTFILALVARLVFKLSGRKALFFALVAGVLDPLIVLMHQLGHAWAARNVGWPMSGISLWSLFSTCYYPADEPELPPEVHLRRAIGGPLVSFFNGLFVGLVGLRLFPRKGVGRLLAQFYMVNASVVRSIMALGPVSFSDGPTIRYWTKRFLAEKNDLAV